MALFLVGWWCIDSANIPPPMLALPLPQRFLSGLGFMSWDPFSRIVLSVILAASGFLVSRLNKTFSAAITVVGLTAVMVGACWVPNPIVLWPVSVLGEHTLPELIGELFTFHIVPSPEFSYGSSAGFDSLFRWQLLESGARFCILIIGWAACLAAIWKIGRRLRTANESLGGMPGRPGTPRLPIGLP